MRVNESSTRNFLLETRAESEKLDRINNIAD